jgi:hypothetical protein
MALMSVLTIIFVLAIVSALVLYLSGKELGLSAVRLRGAQSLYIAEGGAVAARSALMAFMNADPLGAATLDPSLGGGDLLGWYAGGNPSSQDPFGIFDYIVLDGLRFTLGTTPSTTSVIFHVNWSLPEPRRKLQVPSGSPPANPLGGGSYTATVVITRRLAPHPSCLPGPTCYIHRLGPPGSDEYEYFYTYTITGDGRMPAQARRRVTLSRDFSFRARRSSFAEFVLFRHITTTPWGAAVWFINRDRLDGPVHTNDIFRFVQFPKFSDRLTTVNTQAWFLNGGSPVRLSANENVVGGVRIDAPVQFDTTPADLTDDNDNLPANFSRGVAAISLPTNAFSQKGVSVGRDPADTSPVTNMEIRGAVPELADSGAPVPNGIYIPVVDSNGNGVSDPGEPLAGGIYVQGTLDSIQLGQNSDMSEFTMIQGSQTVKVTIDRLTGTTTIDNSAWSPAVRSFIGVPKGWQGPGNTNAVILYVEGGILSLKGVLEEKEQMTIAASGAIYITDHLEYEDPPNVADPNDNPINLLGVYSANNHIVFGASAPTDLRIHGVFMAGNLSDGFNSSVNAENYNTRPIGDLHLIGGIIEEYSGPIGLMNSSGTQLAGYARDFKYDRRMSRGFSPPYFPTTSLFEIGRGSEPLAGVRPIWREASP